MLTDLRDRFTELGHRYEPEDSAFHIKKMKTVEEVSELEESLHEEDAKQLLVGQLGGFFPVFMIIVLSRIIILGYLDSLNPGHY